MQKTVIKSKASAPRSRHNLQDDWLDLDELATVEITSEDPLFPIEHALGSDSTTGWRAAAKGPQFIRLNFAEPIEIRRVHLHFVDCDSDRSQEFAVYARSNGGEMREIVRQQFSFSRNGSTEEIEDYSVDFKAVASLELRIDPDRAHDHTHSQHFAVLQSLRLA